MLKMKKHISILMMTMFAMSLVAGENFPLLHMYKSIGVDPNFSYSADMVIETSMANMPAMTSKIFYKNGNIRTEGSMGGMSYINIVQKDGGVYTFNQAFNSWMKTNVPETATETDTSNLPTYKEVGTEEIDGVKCKKFEMKDPQTNYTGYLWVSEGMIYRNEVMTPQGKTTIKYTNVKKENLDDSLFQLPKDAKVMDMSQMMENFKNMGQGN